MLIDQLILESLHYWPLENEEDIKELKTKLWGYSKNVTNIRGIQGNSLVNTKESGVFSIGNNPSAFHKIQHPARSNCSISLWLKYHSRSDRKGQIFFSTGERGHKIFQHNGRFDHVSYRVSWNSAYCVSVVAAPEGTWSHFAFISEPITTANTKKLTIYLNGEKVSKYELEKCGKESNAHSTGKVMIGDPTKGELPNAALDEILIWDRVLSTTEVEQLYHYYKGFLNFMANYMLVCIQNI